MVFGFCVAGVHVKVTDVEVKDKASNSTGGSGGSTIHIPFLVTRLYVEISSYIIVGLLTK